MATKVIVVGGGFAGLNAAKVLARNPQVEVLLLDRRNHHLFQPLLYQVATAGLSPAEIATPIRSVFSDFPNVRVLMEEVQGIDRHAKTIATSSGSHNYDYLIIATGAMHSYFGHDEWENFAPGLKTLEQATEIRRRILFAFEEAEKISDPGLQKEWLSFVIVGGGPTGVELAGAIAEISRTTLEKDFRHIDPAQTRVLLIEAGPRLLAAFDESLSKRASRDLERMGVQTWTRTRVTEVTAEGVRFGGESVRARTVIWAAGVEASPLGKKLSTPLDRSGRVIVEKDLSLPGDPRVFVIGDLAAFEEASGKTLPGLAPVAMQEGRAAGRNILRDLQGRPREAFRYVDKGIMATIGRRRAIMEVGKLRVGGILAWYAWLFIHIFYLIGFKSRLFVFLQWAWSYLTFKRGARLIVDKDWRLTKS
ncbi:MAG: NAD(P)/FAD-dependent oxidoreductase [Bdellovibrionaceae bacterium]|nr:NAD(P)/FAD-dependent oxidoreductase [Pseudobdellovibrionaceae bacterium]